MDGTSQGKVRGGCPRLKDQHVFGELCYCTCVRAGREGCWETCWRRKQAQLLQGSGWPSRKPGLPPEVRGEPLKWFKYERNIIRFAFCDIHALRLKILFVNKALS